MTHQQRVSRWSRRFVLVGAAFLVCWQVVVLIFAGVLFEAAALAVGLDAGVPAGQLAVLIGACLHLSLLVGVFYTGRRNG